MNSEINDLSRFINAQEGIYDTAINELKNGQKYSHWMWFIFPQINGLGRSNTAKYYSIKSLEEARQYLNHPTLGSRLVECTEALLAIEGRSITQIFTYPDDKKFKSSMTLFDLVSIPDSVFKKALDKYFNGCRDSRTLDKSDK